MNLYFRKNINGNWETISLSEEEVKSIKRDVFNENKSIMKKIKKECPDFTDIERVALFNTLAQHYHYRADDVIEEKLLKKKEIEQKSINNNDNIEPNASEEELF